MIRKSLLLIACCALFTFATAQQCITATSSRPLTYDLKVSWCKSTSLGTAQVFVTDNGRISIRIVSQYQVLQLGVLVADQSNAPSNLRDLLFSWRLLPSTRTFTTDRSFCGKRIVIVIYVQFSIDNEDVGTWAYPQSGSPPPGFINTGPGSNNYATIHRVNLCCPGQGNRCQCSRASSGSTCTACSGLGSFDTMRQPCHCGTDMNNNVRCFGETNCGAECKSDVDCRDFLGSGEDWFCESNSCFCQQRATLRPTLSLNFCSRRCQACPTPRGGDNGGNNGGNNDD